MATKNAVGNSLTGTTGTGSFVGANSPTLITPNLGTPSAIDLSNATAVPAPAESAVTFTDITTNNASTSKHGFLKKLDNNAAHYMDGSGNWSTPAGGGGGITAPGSTTAGNIVTWNATDGTAVADSGIPVSLTLNAESHSIAIGSGAGGSTTLADYTTVMGYNAGANATTSRFTVCVGTSAGLNIRTGQSNTAMGHTALGSNYISSNTASYTTAIGAGACRSVTTGGRNTGTGYTALVSATTGTNNIGLGAGAGPTLDTGTDCTLVGTDSDVNDGAAIGVIAIGSSAIADKATGGTSSDNGAGIAVGSSSLKVGFRGDGTVYSAVGSSAGYWRLKINGTYYKIQLYADA